MYENFYGFHTKPFSMLPDSEFFYRSKGHRFALSLLEYGLGDQTGFTIITGEIGSGKTTLLQYVLKYAQPSHTIGYITNTAELNNDLMRWISYAFGIANARESGVDAYASFVEFVRKRYSEGRDCVLIIDEAQLLDANTMESIRLLSNLNVGPQHVLKIILVGQPELLQTLARPDLIQFAQRVSANFHLKPLSLLETREYIRYRLRTAGGPEALLDETASDLVFIAGGGIPRQINILCDTALVYSYADSRRNVEVDTVISVLRDRSAARHIGSISIPANLDRAAIMRIIQQAREKEILASSEGDPNSAASLETGNVPIAARSATSSETGCKTSAKSSAAMGSQLENSSICAHHPRTVTDRAIGAASVTERTHVGSGSASQSLSASAEKPGSDVIQGTSSAHPREAPSTAKEVKLLEAEDRPTRKRENNLRPSKRLGLAPADDEADVRWGLTKSESKFPLVLWPTSDIARSSSRIRRRTLWIIGFVLFIGVLALGPRALGWISKVIPGM